jgi:hypothetical protein
VASTFEIATRAAIEEMIAKHGQESKFGLILPRESLRDLVDDVFQLIQTSRDLKAAGDRFLRQQSQVSAPTPAKRPTR